MAVEAEEDHHTEAEAGVVIQEDVVGLTERMWSALSVTG